MPGNQRSGRAFKLDVVLSTVKQRFEAERSSLSQGEASNQEDSYGIKQLIALLVIIGECASATSSRLLLLEKLQLDPSFKYDIDMQTARYYFMQPLSQSQSLLASLQKQLYEALGSSRIDPTVCVADPAVNTADQQNQSGAAEEAAEGAAEGEGHSSGPSTSIGLSTAAGTFSSVHQGEGDGYVPLEEKQSTRYCNNSSEGSSNPMLSTPNDASDDANANANAYPGSSSVASKDPGVVVNPLRRS